MSQSTPLFIISVVLIVFAFFVFRRTKRTMKIALASKLWPKTTGRITASVVQFVDEGGDPPTSYYLPQVSYIYTVDNMSYTGTAIAYRTMKCRKKTAEATVAKYPVGCDTEVYYDPTGPQWCILEPGTKGVGQGYLWVTIMILSAVLLTATGIVMLIYKV